MSFRRIRIFWQASIMIILKMYFRSIRKRPKNIMRLWRKRRLISLMERRMGKMGMGRIRLSFRGLRRRRWGGWRLLIWRLGSEDLIWLKPGISPRQILCFYVSLKPWKTQSLCLDTGIKNQNFSKPKEVC